MSKTVFERLYSNSFKKIQVANELISAEPSPSLSFKMKKPLKPGIMFSQTRKEMKNLRSLSQKCKSNRSFPSENRLCYPQKSRSGREFKNDHQEAPDRREIQEIKKQLEFIQSPITYYDNSYQESNYSVDRDQIPINGDLYQRESEKQAKNPAEILKKVDEKNGQIFLSTASDSKSNCTSRSQYYPKHGSIRCSGKKSYCFSYFLERFFFKILPDYPQ